MLALKAKPQSRQEVRPIPAIRYRSGTVDALNIRGLMKTGMMEDGEFYPARAGLQWAGKTRTLSFWSYTLEDPPLTIIELNGRIELAEHLEPIAEIAISSKAEHVAILMQDVEYTNNKALEDLIALHHKVEGRGFRMYAVGPVGVSKAAMEEMGCCEIMRIKESLKEVILEMREL